MTDSFPRLMVATEFPPNASGGGPAVVRQMLKDWPADRLSWWSCFPDRDKRFGQQVAAHGVARIPPKWYPNRKWRGVRSWMMARVWAPSAASHLRRTIAQCKPDAIWVIPHSWAIVPMARVIPKSATGFHVTVQDYADCHCWSSRFGLARTQRMAAMTDLLYQKATTRDATSHPMIADLQKRTGAAAAQMLHAGLEPADFDRLTAKAGTRSDWIRIAYAGTVSVEKSFELFVEELAAIRGQLTRPVSIELFSAHSYRSHRWFDPSWMHERGNLPEPEFSEALRACTWGFAPMSLTEDDPRHFFSFPTKFISYLAAGLPVFTLGHPASSVVQMAQAYEVGVCATSTDRQALREKLLRAFSMQEPWKTFGPEILRCTHREFDATRMRGTLCECFRRCSRK